MHSSHTAEGDAQHPASASQLQARSSATRQTPVACQRSTRILELPSTRRLTKGLLSFPGLLVQRLTVFEPEDDMIEVAINAMKAVIPEDPEKDKI